MYTIYLKLHVGTFQSQINEICDLFLTLDSLSFRLNELAKICQKLFQIFLWPLEVTLIRVLPGGVNDSHWHISSSPKSLPNTHRLRALFTASWNTGEPTLMLCPLISAPPVLPSAMLPFCHGASLSLCSLKCLENITWVVIAHM